jgi:hypothetical protein
MFNLAIDSKPRGCDIVALLVEDVAPLAVDRTSGYWRDRFAHDSALEGAGFELAVPPRMERLWRGRARTIAVRT